jgi:hypothetical protein
MAAPNLAQDIEGRTGGDSALLAWIAEDRRVCDLATATLNAAEELWSGLPEQHRTGQRREAPGKIGELFRRHEALEKKADLLWKRISSTQPNTLGGVIAQLEIIAGFHLPDSDDPEVELLRNVIAGLRAIYG